MRLICLVFLTTLAHVKARNLWLKDLISPKGWDLGYGVVLKLNSAKETNVPILQRLSMDVDLGDLLRISVGKAKTEALQLDFYVKNPDSIGEGREKKEEGNEKRVIPILIGYKLATLGTVALITVKMLSLKALIMAKAALLISLLVFLLKTKSHHPEVIEVQHIHYPSHAPLFLDQGQGHGFNAYGHEGQSSNIYEDVIYLPTPTSPYAEFLSTTTLATNQRRDNLYYRNSEDLTGSGKLLSIKKYESIDT